MNEKFFGLIKYFTEKKIEFYSFYFIIIKRGKITIFWYFKTILNNNLKPESESRIFAVSIPAHKHRF